jgi:tricorn protease
MGLLTVLYLTLFLCSHAAGGRVSAATTVQGEEIAVKQTAQNSPAAPARAGLMRFPAISRAHVAFAYAGDIWVALREGGAAVRLAKALGVNSRMAFSPDGRTLAFSASTDGNPNLYTVPVGPAAAAPMRITHLFNVSLCQWTPRGELLFYTDSLSFSLLAMQLFTVPAAGGLPVKLPVPYGSEAAISPDGEWLAYTPYWPRTNLRQVRRRYTGGLAPDIWLFNLRTHAARRITTWRGSDTMPMWRGKTLYYLSDEGSEHRSNVWAYDTVSGSRKQVTALSDYDINNPSLGPGARGEGEIVFQYGPDLYALDLASGRTRPLEILIPAEQASVKPREVDAGKFITNSELSPDGEEVLVGARGDIWVAPTRAGSAPRNLSRTGGAFERDPTWSPDGRRVAYFSDASGEYELYVTRSDGAGEGRRLTALGAGFRYGPRWSPDSTKIVFTDNAGAIYVHTVASGETKRVDVDPWSQQAATAWSHDSSWLAYTKLGDNRLGAIWLYDTNSGARRQVSSGLFDDSSPVFDRRGDYLFYLSERNFSSPLFDPLDRTFAYGNTTALVAVPLRAGLPSPLAPSRDDGTAAAEASSEARPQARAATDAGDATRGRGSLTIDLEGFDRRAVVLPTQRGNLFGLEVNAGGNPVYAHAVAGGGARSIRIFDLTGEKREEQTVLEGETDFQLSALGRQALVRKGGALYVVAAAPQQSVTGPVSTAGMTLTIEPRAEWRQIFTDVWRLYRDFFYAPNMQGADWPGARAKYQRMLDRCATRDDVNYVIGEMIAEVNTSHAWVANPGDVERPPASTLAMLGADFESENGAYRIVKLYEGAAWDAGARNPLRRAGVNEGDYLLAVNDSPLGAQRDPWAALQNTANKPVTLTVSARPAADRAARKVTVTPLSDDSDLRYRAWVERNRARVERSTNGQVGYLHVPDFTFNGLSAFARQLHGQINKKALIIDPRWSQGGSVGDIMVHLLDQPRLNYYAERYSDRDRPVPSRAMQGPKCVLINHLVVSAGENFSYYFRKSGLGKLVGTRTWGGLVGLNGNPSLIDGGYVQIPNAGFFTEEGEWMPENRGLEPDIEVVDDPSLMADGGDPQLDAAVRLMLEEIKRAPRQAPRRPPYPDRTRMVDGAARPQTPRVTRR